MIGAVFVGVASFIGGLVLGVGSIAWAAFVLATGNIIPHFGFGVDGPREE